MIIYYRVWSWLGRCVHLDYLYWNKDVELSSREEIKEVQSKRLRNMVKYCYDNVPFYNQKFKKAGIKPGDIKSVGDIAKIPSL